MSQPTLREQQEAIIALIEEIRQVLIKAGMIDTAQRVGEKLAVMRAIVRLQETTHE